MPSRFKRLRVKDQRGVVIGFMRRGSVVESKALGTIYNDPRAVRRGIERSEKRYPNFTFEAVDWHVK